MAEMQDGNEYQNESNAQDTPRPEWTEGESKRAGQPPKGFRIRGLEFGGKSVSGSPTLESIGLEELIGATAFKSANLKANHTEPGALTGMLAETMQKLEEKYHSGVYDAAALPLVEQYLAEMRHMANLQLERFDLIARRVSDVKEANEKAYRAVYEARMEREAEIRESCQLIQDERRIARLKRKRYRQIRRDAKQNRRLMKEMERSERRAAKNANKRIQEGAQGVLGGAGQYSYDRAYEERMSEGAAMAQEELRRAAAVSAAKHAKMSEDVAAAKVAERDLARAHADIAKRSLREQQSESMDAIDRSINETKEVFDEQISIVEAELGDSEEQSLFDVEADVHGVEAAAATQSGHDENVVNAGGLAGNRGERGPKHGANNVGEAGSEEPGVDD